MRSGSHVRMDNTSPCTSIGVAVRKMIYDLQRKAWKIEAHVGYTDMMNNGCSLKLPVPTSKTAAVSGPS